MNLQTTLSSSIFFYRSAMTRTSSIFGSTCILFYILTLYLIINDTQSYNDRFQHSMNFKKLRWTLKHRYNQTYCEFCDLVVPVIRLLIEANQTNHIENVVNEFCREFKLIDIDVCIGAVHEYRDAVIEIISLSQYNNKQLCALALNCHQRFDYPVLTWNVTFPSDKQKPLPNPPSPPKPGLPTLNILHLSDIHVDFKYKPGSEVDCIQPLCCRDNQPEKFNEGHRGASFWGELHNCDIPYWTAEAILEYAAKFEKIDFIYYTGDIPAHNVWNQSREEQLYSLNNVNQLLSKLFPNKTFYSSVGNHEAAPCNLFPTPNIHSTNISWLYEALADNWIKLGLSNETRESIKSGGFYTTLVRPGLRLISLNMNYCSPANLWLFINSTDPLNQLQWMIQWLQYAEDHQEKVHIIGHIPPKECLPSFSWNFHKIVNRYENTISGQFYGHTHNDEFVINYDEIYNKRPISMAYITPSLTTYAYLNPGYRIYKVDGDYSNSSYWVLDHRTVILNLTATNKYNQTIFLDEYNACNAYDMEYLFPNDWHKFIEKLKSDIDGPMMSLVYQYYTKSFEDGSRCDHNCRHGLLCDFITSRSEDPHSCDSIPS